MALAACSFISFLIRNGAEGPGRGERKGKQQKITSPGRPARPTSRRRRRDLIVPAGAQLPGGRAPAFRPAAALWGGERARSGGVAGWFGARPCCCSLYLVLSICKMGMGGLSGPRMDGGAPVVFLFYLDSSSDSSTSLFVTIRCNNNNYHSSSCIEYSLCA